jgi:hypothetical protein
MSSHQYRFQSIPDGYRLAATLWRAEMKRREFIPGLGGAAASPVATLTPDVIMANISTVTPLLQVTRIYRADKSGRVVMYDHAP